jgi:translocation and assembly module TamB
LHASLPPVDGHLQIDWHQDQLQCSARLFNLADLLSCKISGYMQSPDSFSQWKEAKGDLDGLLEGRLGLFSYLFTSEDFDFDGQVNGKLHIKGSGKRPMTKGLITIDKGSYDHYPIGLTLRNVQVQLSGKGTKIHLDHLKASDGTGGFASAYGDLSLLGATSSQSFLTFKNFRFLHIPLVTAAASGQSQFLHKGKGAQLKGEIELSQAQIRLPDQLPSPVPQLDAYNVVYEIDTPLNPKIKTEELFTGKVEFDLMVQIPKAQVLGRGLDTHWKGNLHLKGSDEDPLLKGHIDLETGEFAFSSKKFAVKEGYLDFAGNPLQESTIHMIAEMMVDQVTLRAILNGPLAKPRLQFRSTPNLSMADFFSYLLFSQPQNSLSGFQAIQVAQLALDASGDGSVGFFSQIRKNAGIDRLEVGSRDDMSSDHDGDLYTIKVGKYLSEGLLVGVSKDVSAEGTQITFELDLTKHLSLITEIGYLTSSSVNLMWKKEY